MTELTEQQRANLAQLAAYLRTLPADYPDFAMDEYAKAGGGRAHNAAHQAECGTAACAAGHGPVAGIAPLLNEWWWDYSCRAFCTGRAWTWCFDEDWAHVDNTAHGAAARIEWLLVNGLPDDSHDQMWGNNPLCYLSLLATPHAGARK